MAETKWYKCLIRGDNFPGELVGEDHPVGFYTIQFVEDVSAADAELAALKLLKQHPSLQFSAEARKASSPTVHFEEIVEVDARDVGDCPQQGLSIFPMEH